MQAVDKKKHLLVWAVGKQPSSVVSIFTNCTLPEPRRVKSERSRIIDNNRNGQSSIDNICTCCDQDNATTEDMIPHELLQTHKTLAWLVQPGWHKPSEHQKNKTNSVGTRLTIGGYEQSSKLRQVIVLHPAKSKLPPTFTSPTALPIEPSSTYLVSKGSQWQGTKPMGRKIII